MYIPELDQFHHIFEPATDCGDLRRHVPGYYQDVSTNSAHGNAACFGVWSTIFYAPESR